MESGELSVMTPGELLMPVLCVGSLDTHLTVCFNLFKKMFDSLAIYFIRCYCTNKCFLWSRNW